MSDTSTLLNPLTGLPINDSDIQSLAELVNEQVSLEETISDHQEKMKNLGERCRYISEVLIPDKLGQLGMASIKMASGHKVEVKPFYSAKILGPEGFVWLDENGHGGIIKTKVVREFSRTQREDAIKFAEENPGFSFDQSVHFQTMSAFTKEIYTNNETLPPELFSVFQGKKTKISTK